jgi:hypothetical protein
LKCRRKERKVSALFFPFIFVGRAVAKQKEKHTVVVKKILSQILGRFIVIKRERENIEVMEKPPFLSNTAGTKISKSSLGVVSRHNE